MANTAAQNAAVAAVAKSFSSPTNSAAQNAAIANVQKSFQATPAQAAYSAAGNTGTVANNGTTYTPPAAAPAAAPITASSGTAVKDQSTLGTNISHNSDPAYLSPGIDTSYVDQHIADLTAQYGQQQASINANYDALAASTAAKQASETGTTSASLARMGGYLGNSGSGTGVMLSLANAHRAELQGLETKRQSDLLAASTAYQEKNFAAATQKYNDAKAAEQTAYNRKQDYLTQMAAANKAQATQQAQASIYDAISKGATQPGDIFAQLGGAVPIEEINSFLTAITPKTPAGAVVYTPTQTASLLGAGLAAPDIKAAQSYIDANGYTDQFRSLLSSQQKVAFDAIYRGKDTAAKLDTSLTDVGGRKVLVNTQTGAIIKDLGPSASPGTTATEGQDLADAKVFMSANPNVDKNAVMQAFLAKHPSSATAWSAYFTASDTGKVDNYPSVTTPENKPFWQFW